MNDDVLDGNAFKHEFPTPFDWNVRECVTLHELRMRGFAAMIMEKPRWWEKVFDDTQKDHFVYNVAGHLGNVKSPVVKARQRTFLLTFLCLPDTDKTFQCPSSLLSLRTFQTALLRPSGTRRLSLLMSRQPRLRTASRSTSVRRTSSRRALSEPVWGQVGL